MKIQEHLLLFLIQGIALIILVHDHHVVAAEETATATARRSRRRLTTPQSTASTTIVDKEEEDVSPPPPLWMPKPKMNAKPIKSGGPSLYSKDLLKDQLDDIDKSKVAFFIGTCSSDAPFQFSIGGKSGQGVIGFDTTSSNVKDEDISLTFVGVKEKSSKITLLKDEVETNLFAPLGEKNTSSFHGIPFKYEGRESKSLSSVQVNCPNKNPTDILIIVGDDGHEYAQAKISQPHRSETVHVQLLNPNHGSSNLKAAPLKTAGSTRKSSGEEHITTGNENSISFNVKKEQEEVKKPSPSTYEKKEANTTSNPDCSLVQMVLTDSNGQDVPKSLVVCNKDQSNSVLTRRQLFSSNDDHDNHDHHGVKVESAEIDENGDFVVNFASLHSSSSSSSHDAESLEDDGIITAKFDVRIGINSECKQDEIIEVVDMSAMLLSSKPTMIVNGGWFRRARELHGIHDCQESWEPVVMEVVVTDPQSRYAYITHLSDPAEVKVMTGTQSHGNAHRKLTEDELHRRRSFLAARASSEEMDITQEMSVGRKPENMIPSSGLGSGRKLQSPLHKKILIHGYCSLGVWPESDFTDAITFADPARNNPIPSSWSNDLFARKIDRFANDNGITGCGIIAHSQGGMAALHLHANYWSCLDSASLGGGRLIQSVGTPYKGTPLAGNLALIGGIFGAGCGRNTDLTDSGARAWLATIPNSNYASIYHYTTSHKTSFLSNYCNLLTDTVLEKPNDGVMERKKGKLNMANNMGHTRGQCHTIGMRYRAQYKDGSRNSSMNGNAKY